MGRRYTVAGYRTLVDKLRRARPDIALSTDLIVGFPGETRTIFARPWTSCARLDLKAASPSCTVTGLVPPPSPWSPSSTGRSRRPGWPSCRPCWMRTHPGPGRPGRRSVRGAHRGAEQTLPGPTDLERAGPERAHRQPDRPRTRGPHRAHPDGAHPPSQEALPDRGGGGRP